MGHMNIDDDVKLILKHLQKKGENLSEVIRQLVYREITQSEDLQEIISDEEWQNISNQVVESNHGILEQLAK